MGGSGRPPDHAHVVTGIPAKSVGLPEASQVGGEAHADWQPPTPETRGGVDFTSYLQVHPLLSSKLCPALLLASWFPSLLTHSSSVFDSYSLKRNRHSLPKSS